MRTRDAVAALAVLAAIAGFLALGLWQLERRTWKLELIARVEERVDAPPVAPPGPSEWPHVTAASDEYRRVAVTGRFLHDREVRVQAVTELGAGYWVVTPLATDEVTLLVNRGFVPPERRDPATRRAGLVPGAVTVTGLLRISEPGGGFLRSNDPAAGRWYSRDVAAIAAAQGLGGPVAPFFIDADATPNPGGWPVGGLTVLRFRNTHLAYALTWFGLAAGLGIAAAAALRSLR